MSKRRAILEGRELERIVMSRVFKVCEKDEWEKVVDELKNIEKRTEEKQFETPENVE